MSGKYKETGIAWCPRIPEEWEVRLLSQTAQEHYIKKPKDEMFPVLSLSYGNIIVKNNINAGLVPQNYDNYQVVEKGNIILRLTDLQNDHTSLRTGLAKDFGIITSAYLCIETKENPDYLHYLLHAYDVKKVFYGMGSGVRQSLSWSDMRRLSIPVPPLAEQNKIVAYLDSKVSKINTLVNIKKKQIESLEELKKAKISHYVTRGLNKNAPLKESGIAWLGKILQGWEVVPLKRTVSVRNQKSEFKATNGDKYIGLENIQSYSNELLETATEYEDSVQSVCCKGDIMFGKLRPYLSKVIISPCDAFCTSELLIMYDFKGISEYLRYLLLNQQFISTVNASTYGAKMPRANGNFILNLSIPVPPLPEQKEIVLHLDSWCAKVSKAIANLTAEIQNLESLKTRLISDVVTGVRRV